MSKFDHEKLNRQKRLHYIPAPRARPATPKQLNFIEGLCIQKGQRISKLPKTLGGASDQIQRLLELPDIEIPEEDITLRPVAPRDTTRQEVIAEFRQRFPQLSPQTASSIVQVFEQVDDVGMLFTLDGLMTDTAPSDPGELIMHILRRFLDQL